VRAAARLQQLLRTGKWRCDGIQVHVRVLARRLA